MFTVVKVSFIKKVVIDFPMLTSQKFLPAITLARLTGYKKASYMLPIQMSLSRDIEQKPPWRHSVWAQSGQKTFLSQPQVPIRR